MLHLIRGDCAPFDEPSILRRYGHDTRTDAWWGIEGIEKEMNSLKETIHRIPEKHA